MEGQKARKKQTNTPPEGLLDAISAGSVAAAEMKKIRLVPYYKRITCLNIGKGTDEGRKDYRTTKFLICTMVYADMNNLFFRYYKHQR